MFSSTAFFLSTDHSVSRISSAQLDQSLIWRILIEIRNNGVKKKKGSFKLSVKLYFQGVKSIQRCRSVVLKKSKESYLWENPSIGRYVTIWPSSRRIYDVMTALQFSFSSLLLFQFVLLYIKLPKKILVWVMY